MSNDTQRTWTRKDSEDAARLLQELAQRGKKAVEAVSSTQIFEPGVSLPEKGRGSAGGVANPRPAIVAILGWSRGNGIANNDNRRDRNVRGDNAPVAGRCCFQRFGE
jgi:hypothetical protein